MTQGEEEYNAEHRAGFIGLLGKPNAGKSTLMNALIGEKLSAVTPKAQTTRHRILGIINGEGFQMVVSDMPGIIRPKYELQKAMMSYINPALEDSDLMLFLTVPGEESDEEILEKLRKTKSPVFLIVNKRDLFRSEEAERHTEIYKGLFSFKEVFIISAKEKTGTSELFEKIKQYLPVHPPYFPKDELSDKTERFFVSEIVREKIFNNYEKEIPYSCEVVTEEFKEEEDIIRIRVLIVTERESQKAILIGHKGAGLKKTGTEARKDLENFFGKKVYLEQYIKVIPDWRKQKNKLSSFGYPS